MKTATVFCFAAAIIGSIAVPPSVHVLPSDIAGQAKLASILANANQAVAANNAARAAVQIKQQNIAAQVRLANDVANQLARASLQAVGANIATGQDGDVIQSGAAIQGSQAQAQISRDAAIQQAQVRHQAEAALVEQAVAAQLNEQAALIDGPGRLVVKG